MPHEPRLGGFFLRMSGVGVLGAWVGWDRVSCYSVLSCARHSKGFLSNHHEGGTSLSPPPPPLLPGLGNPAGRPSPLTMISSSRLKARTCAGVTASCAHAMAARCCARAGCASPHRCSLPHSHEATAAASACSGGATAAVSMPAGSSAAPHSPSRPQPHDASDSDGTGPLPSLALPLTSFAAASPASRWQQPSSSFLPQPQPLLVAGGVTAAAGSGSVSSPAFSRACSA